MKAVRFIDGRMQLCDVPGRVPGDGQVLVAVRSAGTCSSDLHVARLGLLDPETTVGHEIARALITHRYPLDAVDETFEAASRRSEGAIEVVFDPAS